MSFSFGTPSSAPATSGLTGGFNFGANKPATPGFGLNTSQPTGGGLFGTPATSEAPAFGSTPTFGAAAPTPAFGAAAPAPAFGATAAAPAFGATSAAPSFGASLGTSFGATSAAPAFGATTTPAFGTGTPAFGTTTPGFGATSAAPAFGTSSAAPAFGTTTLAFGASAAPTFGTTTTPAFGASTSSTFGTTTPAFGTAAGGLNFGAGSNAAPAAGLTFGAPAATAASTGLGGLGTFGGFGSTSTATTTNTLFGAKVGITSVTGTQPSTSATASFGLGGIAGASSGAPNAATDAKNEPPKQNKLPNEISTSVDAFKEFVKKQKSLSSEVMRVSIKPLHKVSREAEARLREAAAACAGGRRARARSRCLRATAAAALAAAEAASRDSLQPGSELESTAPPSYVKDLISELEQQLITFRRQMDVADKQMQSSPKLLTEQELTLGIRRMHESLVALAGRLQAVHTQVEAQKEQYLNLRKYILKDPTNVFDVPHPSTTLDQILRESENNRKKMKSGTLTDMNQTSAVLSDPRAVLGNIQHLAGPTPFTYVGSTVTAFPTPDTNVPSWQPAPAAANTSLNVSFGTQQDSSSFQLQKPPGKRGKQ